MIQQWLNGKTLLFIIAVSIVTGTVFYSRYLSKKIADDEKRKVEIWVEAQKTIIDATDQASFNLAAKISSENKEIPIIETDENDNEYCLSHIHAILSACAWLCRVLPDCTSGEPATGWRLSQFQHRRGNILPA